MNVSEQRSKYIVDEAIYARREPKILSNLPNRTVWIQLFDRITSIHLPFRELDVGDVVEVLKAEELLIGRRGRGSGSSIVDGTKPRGNLSIDPFPVVVVVEHFNPCEADRALLVADPLVL